MMTYMSVRVCFRLAGYRMGKCILQFFEKSLLSVGGGCFK